MSKTADPTIIQRIHSRRAGQVLRSLGLFPVARQSLVPLYGLSIFCWAFRFKTRRSGAPVATCVTLLHPDARPIVSHLVAIETRDHECGVTSRLRTRARRGRSIQESGRSKERRSRVADDRFPARRVRKCVSSKREPHQSPCCLDPTEVIRAGLSSSVRGQSDRYRKLKRRGADVAEIRVQP